MVASETLRRELDDTERGIEDLREVRHRVEADFRPIRRQAGWIRAFAVYLLRRDLDRRIENLALHRDIARNCHAEARRYEEWLKAPRRSEEREGVAR